MDDEVGIAADRRGEMGVAAQVEAEMAVVLRRVFRLRLGAQHHLVDEVLVGACCRTRVEDAVEQLGPQRALRLGSSMPIDAQELAERLPASPAGLVVHAIDQRRLLAFQRLGCGNVGEDHELLDQPCAHRAASGRHTVDRAVLLQQQLALGQVEIERAARLRGAIERVIGRPTAASAPARAAGLSCRRACRRWRPAPVDRRAWPAERIMMRWKVCCSLRPLCVDDHAHGERGAVVVGLQRAQVVRDALGQHRHDAIGEIDRIAALQRLAVERGAWPDIGRDIGDGDGEDEAARIVGVVVRLGMHGVVVVLGVGGVDGDERQARASPRGSAIFAGRAFSASASVPGRKTCGMPCV